MCGAIIAAAISADQSHISPRQFAQQHQINGTAANNGHRAIKANNLGVRGMHGSLLHCHNALIKCGASRWGVPEFPELRVTH